MRHGRDQHLLVKAYASARNISLRTAQLHRQRRDPLFLEFLSRQANTAVRTATAPVGKISSSETFKATPVTQFEDSGDDLEKARRMEREAYQFWQSVAATYGELLACRDINATQWSRAEKDAQESYRKSKRARETAEIAAGRLVPASQIADLRRRFIQPIRAVLANMPSEVGPRANSFDPAFGIQACQEWLRSRFTPQLAAVEKEFSKYETSDPIPA
jgi:hypothetical protein